MESTNIDPLGLLETLEWKVLDDPQILAKEYYQDEDRYIKLSNANKKIKILPADDFTLVFTLKPGEVVFQPYNSDGFPILLEDILENIWLFYQERKDQLDSEFIHSLRFMGLKPLAQERTYLVKFK